jgi:hypothetical protein
MILVLGVPRCEERIEARWKASIAESAFQKLM